MEATIGSFGQSQCHLLAVFVLQLLPLLLQGCLLAPRQFLRSKVFKVMKTNSLSLSWAKQIIQMKACFWQKKRINKDNTGTGKYTCIAHYNILFCCLCTKIMRGLRWVVDVVGCGCWYYQGSKQEIKVGLITYYIQCTSILIIHCK